MSNRRDVQGMKKREANERIAKARASRTRTMDSDTQEFRAVAPGASPSEPPRVSSNVAPGSGVQPMRRSSAADGRGRHEGISKTAIIGISVAAVAVFVVVFLLVRGAITSIDRSSIEAGSASSATDAYTMFAVSDEPGDLTSLYLGYVDSINGRFELAHIDPNVMNASGTETLGEMFARSGLDAVRSALVALSSVQIPTAMEVTSNQMSDIVGLCVNENAADVQALANAILSKEQLIGETAALGMLRTIQDVDASSFVELEAPTIEPQHALAEPVLLLDQGAWFTMVRGMRDTSSDVSFS